MTATALQDIHVALPRRSWPRYPDYRSTGVAWLAEMPTHWAIKRLRYAVGFPSKGEVRALPLDTPVSFVPMEAVGEYGGLSLDQTRPIEEVLSGYTYFRDGDVLVAKITPCFENGKGALAEGLENGVGFGTTELHVLRVGAEILPTYLFYLTLGEHFRKLGTAEMYGAGGQKRVPESFLQNLRHPLPPLDEQRAIVAFLDRETILIDELIAKKRAILTRLAEKRSIIISHAITNGIKSAPSQSISGIEWLPSIPRHWEMKRLKHVADLQTGLTLGKKYGEEIELLRRPYLRVANVQDGFLDLAEITTVEVPPGDIPRYELRPGDVLMTEGGDFDKLGRGYVWDGQIEGCLHQNHIFAVRPYLQVLDSHYLATLLSSSHGRNYFTSTSQQTTNLASTNSTKLKEFPVPLPSREEQTVIMTAIRAACQKIDDVTHAIQVAIQKLREHRTSLISSAVTGQIDVRKYRKEAPCP